MLALNWLVGPVLVVCCSIFVQSLPTLSPDGQVNDCSVTVIPKYCKDWTDADCQDKCLLNHSNFNSSCIWFDGDGVYVSCPWECKRLNTSDLCNWCKEDKKCVGPTEPPTTETPATESPATESTTTESPTAESTATDSADRNGQQKSDERNYTFAFVILVPILGVACIILAFGFSCNTLGKRFLRCIGKHKEESTVLRNQTISVSLEDEETVALAA